MATTQILGIRNNLDAANFLAYDFLNNGGNNNPMLFTGLGKGGGRSVGYEETELDRGYKFVDNITADNIEKVTMFNWSETSDMPSNLPVSSISSQGYVYLLTSDNGLSNLQNRLWTYYSNYKRSGGSGAFVTAPWLPTQYNPGTQNTVLTTNSMWIGDTPERRALWDGPPSNATLMTGYDISLVSSTAQPGSVVGYSGAPRRNSSNRRYIPGTNLADYYIEPVGTQ
jgi:hypothetical protein